MSLDSLRSRDFYGGGVGHQLSATRLLSSPEGSRRPPDGYDERSWTWGRGDSCSSARAEDRAGARPQRGALSLAWGCFRGCRARVRRALAKRKVEQGVRLYNQHRQQQAVRKWKSALKTIRKREDKFELLGYLYQAYMDWGKYRDALEFAHRQLYISEELDSPAMRAESHLNLARCHQRLGALERALAYARHSLYNECERCATAGHVHLTVGSVYLELAGFNKALDSFQHAHRIAQAARDSSLELQVYVGLSELFGRLRDADAGARYASKAYDLSRSLQLGDLNSRHHRAALLQMASALRRQGELGDAHDYCSEATRLALVSGDQATYARSIRIMGDIYRKRNDINKAFRQYETAMGSAAAMGDRVVQMESMDGAARCLEALRLQGRICNCRPLEFNTRLLEVASSVGAKLLVRAVRARLSRIYRALGDDEQRAHQERAIARLLRDDLLGAMTCAGCRSPYGLDGRRDALEALPCAHIVHARCAYELARGSKGRGHRNNKRRAAGACPECERAAQGPPAERDGGDAAYSPVALSICSSSSDSHRASHHATSSV